VVAVDRHTVVDDRAALGPARHAALLGERERRAVVGPPLLPHLGLLDRLAGQLLQFDHRPRRHHGPPIAEPHEQCVDRFLALHLAEVLHGLHARPPIDVLQRLAAQLLDPVRGDVGHRAEQRAAHAAARIVREGREEHRQVLAVDARERLERVAAHVFVLVPRQHRQLALRRFELQHAERPRRPPLQIVVACVEGFAHRVAETLVAIDAEKLGTPLAHALVLPGLQFVLDAGARVVVGDLAQPVPDDVAVVARRQMQVRAALGLLEHLEQHLHRRDAVLLQADVGPLVHFLLDVAAEQFAGTRKFGRPGLRGQEWRRERGEQDEVGEAWHGGSARGARHVTAPGP